MKSYRALAWKELKAEKVTSTLILIAIVLSTVMTTVAGQSIGILRAMRIEQAAALNGNRYATLHQLTLEQADALSEDSRLSYAEKMISVGVSDIPNSKISVLLREYEGNALSAYKDDVQIESGRIPEHAGEIALPRDVLSLLNFEGEIGDSISLPVHVSLMRDSEAAYEYNGDFILVGILKSNYVGYVTGSTMGIVGTGTAANVLPLKYRLYSVDIRTTDKERFQQTLDDLTKVYGIPDYCIQYNDILLSAANIPYRSADATDIGSGFSYMAVASVLIGVLVLLAAGLVIYNILKIVVTKHISSYGTLRALGATRGSLYTLISLQITILCGVGIPIGILLGMLSTQSVLTTAASFFNPDIFMASSQNEVTEMIAANAGGNMGLLVISAGITLLFAFIAAMPAAGYAAKVSPTIAMSGHITAVKRRNRKTGRIRSFEAFYARMNMKRNRGRTVITLLSLTMSITVFVALQSFSGLLDASAGIGKMHLGDYSMTNRLAGFSQEDVTELRSISGIERVSTLKFCLYMADEAGEWDGIDTSFTAQPGETIQIISIDEERIASIAPMLSKQDLQELRDGTSCLIKNPLSISFGDADIENTELSVDDNISVNGVELCIASILNMPVTIENEGFINGIQIIVSDRVYNELTGQTTYVELYPTLSDGADRKAIEQLIEKICHATGGTWISYENTDKQLDESYENIQLLVWGFILLISLIGILNIINTVYTNIHSRIVEIGVQRAIGMSTGSLYKTFLWEGAYYGVFAAIIGGMAGYVCTIFINAASTEVIQLTAIPVLAIAKATMFSIAACIIATCIPLNSIVKMDIVESIETVE